MRPETVLLRISACPEGDFTADLDSLDETGWETLLDMSSRMRTLPLVEQAIIRAGLQSRIPVSCAQSMAEQQRWQTMSAFGNQVALTQVFDFLARHGIHPVALKGARLAHIDYPDARLRPMRDIDLLVPPEDAERAQQLLIDSGDYEVAEWTDLYGIDYGHQLPDLLDIRRGVSLEIHHRLNARGWAQEPMLVRMVHAEAQEMVLSGKTIRVPSIHANFLHLVEHATLHHAFENGPLTLADLHYTAASGRIDWPLLARQAEEMGVLRSLQLVAALARRHGATWVPDIIDTSGAELAHHVDVAEEAILRDEDSAEHHAFLRNLSMRKGQQPGWLAAVRAALTPNPVSLGSMLRLSEDNPLRWAAYPAWLATRATKYLAARRINAIAGNTAKEVAMLKWLHKN